MGYLSDGENTFLHGSFKELVDTKSPPGYSSNLSLVCKLKKFLHWLKQAPRAWFDHFRQVLWMLFVQTGHESSLFIKQL